MEDKNNILDNRLKGKNPFSVPENYFDSFSSRLQDKIALAGTEKKSQQIMPRIRYFAYPLLAAGIALIMYLSVNIFHPNMNRNSFTTEEISAYFDRHPQDIDDLIPDMLDAQKSEATQPNDTINYLISENLNDYELFTNLK